MGRVGLRREVGGQVGGWNAGQQGGQVAEPAEEGLYGGGESGVGVLGQQGAGLSEETVPQLLELRQSPPGDEAQRDFSGHVLRVEHAVVHRVEPALLQRHVEEEQHALLPALQLGDRAGGQGRGGGQAGSRQVQTHGLDVVEVPGGESVGCECEHPLLLAGQPAAGETGGEQRLEADGEREGQEEGLRDRRGQIEPLK